MRHALSAWIYCVLLTSVPLRAQQSATSIPPGAVVLQQALGVLAGSTSIADVTLSGTVRRIAGSDDETGTVVLKALVTGQSRMDLSTPSGQSSEIRSISSNGNQLGAWIGTNGVSHPIPLHNLITTSAWFQPALAFGGIVSSQTFTVLNVGSENKDGMPVIHLIVTQQLPDASSDIPALLQHLSQMDVFLDTMTLLPIALDFNVHPDNNELFDIPVEIRFSNYTAASGVQIPFHIQKYLNNSLFLDIQLQTATLNSGLAPSAFTVQ